MLVGLAVATPKAWSQEGFAEGARGKRRAFLVACQNYPRSVLNPLRFTHNDVLSFKEALLHTAFAEEDIVLLYDRDEPKQEEKFLPKAANIAAQFQTFLKDVGEEDTLIVALAGHGVRLKQEEPKSGSGGNGGTPPGNANAANDYFCPIDANLRDRNTLINLARMYKQLKDCPAKHKLLLVDACREDPFANATRDTLKADFVLARVQDVPRGVAALFSCSPGELSHEDRDLRHGVFFHHLLEAWNGAAYDNDNKLSLSQVFDYTIKTTAESVQKKFPGASQTPQQRVEVSGSWELFKERVGELQWFPEHAKAVSSVAFCLDGQRAISGSFDDKIRLWDLRSRKVLRCLEAPKTNELTPIYCLAVAPKGRSALYGWGKMIRFWDLESGNELYTLYGHEGPVLSVAITPAPEDQGRFVLSGGGFNDHTVRWWDLKDRKELYCFRGHQNEVYSVAFSPDGRQALSGSADQTIRLWDLKNRTEWKKFTGHQGAVHSVVFSPDGRFILSGGDDKIVRLWDVATRQELRRFEGHTAAVRSVAFSPKDGRRILSGSKDGTVRLWDVTSGKELRRFQRHTGNVLSVAFSPDGYRALSGGLDCTMRLWALPRK
jgi:WD40 repeat protein